MASEVKTNKISPATATTINVGDSGDTLALATDAVTGFNVGSDAQGDILYHDGTDYTRLGAGTSGHFLKTQGTSANPVWAADSSGALVHLHTTTVSSVVSEIQVNDVFSATYTNYKIIVTNIVPDTDSTIYMGFKENSGATQLNMHSLTRYFGVNNAGATIYGDSSEYNMGGQELFKTASSTVGINGIIEVYVPFASGTNNMTRTTYTLTGWNAAASGEVHTYGMSQAGATTSTPCFRLFSSGNIGDATITGYIRVYGYKDS